MTADAPAADAPSAPTSIGGIPAWAIIALFSANGAGTVVSGVSSSKTAEEVNTLKKGILEDTATRQYVEREAARLATLEEKISTLKEDARIAAEDSIRRHANLEGKLTQASEVINRYISTAETKMDGRISSLEDRLLALGQALAAMKFPADQRLVPQNLPSSKAIRMRRESLKK